MRTLAFLGCVLALAGCRPSYGQRKKDECNQSIRARADGRYADPPAEQAARSAFGDSCSRACTLGADHDACVEYALLEATESEATAASMMLVYCREGKPLACDWIAAHPAAAAAAEQESDGAFVKRKQAYEASLVPPTTLDEFAAGVYRISKEQESTVTADQTVTLDGAGAVVGVSMDARVAYAFFCMAETPVTFQASLRSEVALPRPFEAYDAGEDFFVRQLLLPASSSEDLTTEIVLTQNDGATAGPVRCVQLGK